ncbi:MAG: hypothetical protein WAT70_10135 [Rhizobiaceae bacterium]
MGGVLLARSLSLAVALSAATTAHAGDVDIGAAANCVRQHQSKDMLDGVRATLVNALQGKMTDSLSPIVEFVFVLQDQCGVALPADDPKNMDIFLAYFRLVAAEMVEEAAVFISRN